LCLIQIVHIITYTYVHLCTRMYKHVFLQEALVSSPCLIHIMYVYIYIHLCTPMHTYVHICIDTTSECGGPASCLRGSKLQDSFAKEAYKRDDILQKRPITYHITGECGGPASCLRSPRCSVYVDACTLGYVDSCTLRCVPSCTLRCVVSCTLRCVHESIVYMYTYVGTSPHDITSTYILYTCTPTYTYVHLCTPTYAYLFII